MMVHTLFLPIFTAAKDEKYLRRNQNFKSNGNSGRKRRFLTTDWPSRDKIFKNKFYCLQTRQLFWLIRCVNIHAISISPSSMDFFQQYEQKYCAPKKLYCILSFSKSNVKHQMTHTLVKNINAINFCVVHRRS